MRFYQECVHVAKSVGALLAEEEKVTFINDGAERIEDYQITLGMWIRNHLLPHNAYLSKALTLLGYTTAEEQSMYLIYFAHQYWKLSREEML